MPSGLISSATTKSQWPFSPQCIGGLNMWLDGADINTMFRDVEATFPITTDGQTINAWKDKSKNGYLFTTIPSYDGPMYTASGLNGRSVTSWNGTTQILQSSTQFPFYTDAFSGGSFFTVFNPTSMDSQRFLMYYQNRNADSVCGSATEFGYSINGQGTIGLHQGCGDATLTAPGSLSASNNTIISYILGTSGTTPDNSSIYLNSTSYTSIDSGKGFYSAGSYPSFNNAQKLNIGGRYIQDIEGNPDCFHQGTIAELLWFNVPVSDTQRAQIEGYLAAKWGLQANLPSVHTYKSTVPYNRPFQPVDIPECMLWLDSVDKTSINSTTWKDKSGFSYNFTPNSGTISTNSSGVLLSGDKYFIENTIIPIPRSYSIFVVASATSTSVDGYNRIINMGSNNYGFVGAKNSAFATFTGDGVSFFDDTANSPSSSIANSTPYVMKMVVNGTTVSSSFNGRVLDNKTNSGITEATTGMQLGYNGQNWTGGVAEVILYNAALPMSQQLQIESYLGQKWGLANSLVAGHPGRLLPSFSSIFTPKSISGIQLWLDGADSSTVIIAENNVSAWNDKSGNANNLNKEGSGKIEYNQSSNVIEFSGQADLVGYGGLNYGETAAPLTIFIVATSLVSALPPSPLYSTSDFIIQNGLFVRYYSDEIYLGNGGGNWAFAPSPIIYGTRYMYSIKYTGSPGTNTLWVNGYSKTPIIDVDTRGALKRDFFRLGYLSGEYLNGSINEVMLFNSAIPISQQQQIEGYLAWKWGLQGNLPSTHAYAKCSP